MSWATFKSNVKRLFVKKAVGADGLIHATLGIAGEAGEIVDAVKKHWVYGKKLDVANLKEEVGDLLFYIQALCQVAKIDMVQCLKENEDKLRKRYPNGYTDAAAIERADKKEGSHEQLAA